MSTHRLTTFPYVCIILRNNENILLLHRTNTSALNNTWAIPGGAIERHETIIDAAVREAHEELGVSIHPSALTLMHVLHAYRSTGDTLGFYVVARSWEGEPTNMEPEKHSELTWFNINDLPANTLSSARKVIHLIEQEKKLGSSMSIE